jgi:hypothetical protein
MLIEFRKIDVMEGGGNAVSHLGLIVIKGPDLFSLFDVFGDPFNRNNIVRRRHQKPK